MRCLGLTNLFYTVPRQRFDSSLVVDIVNRQKNVFVLVVHTHCYAYNYTLFFPENIRAGYRCVFCFIIPMLEKLSFVLVDDTRLIIQHVGDVIQVNHNHLI